MSVTLSRCGRSLGYRPADGDGSGLGRDGRATCRGPAGRGAAGQPFRDGCRAIRVDRDLRAAEWCPFQPGRDVAGPWAPRDGPRRARRLRPDAGAGRAGWHPPGSPDVRPSGPAGVDDGTDRSGAVALVVVAGYWATASTSFANPAVTIARAWTDTHTGIRPTDVLPFVLAQAAGASLALLFWREGKRRALSTWSLPASTTRGARRWQRRSSIGSPILGWRGRRRRAPSQRIECTPRFSRSWPRWAWIWPMPGPSC